MKIVLISMPFVELKYPSLALTQLKARLRETWGNKVLCSIHYLYHDFAEALGEELYNVILHQLNPGLGEWFFRQEAFPRVSENNREYFASYYPEEQAENRALCRRLEAARKRLPAILHKLSSCPGLKEADVAGFSSIFFQNTASLALARLLKENNPDIITLLGGANADFPMGNVLLEQTDSFDYTFSGPALESLPRFIGKLLAGESEPGMGINGVFSRRNPCPEPGQSLYGKNLDINHRLPLDYEDFLTSYEHHFPQTSPHPYLFFATSRGCYRGEQSPCTFCAQAGPGGNNMHFSAMTPENALATIGSLQHYAARAEVLYATDSILPRDYPQKVFPQLDSRIPLHYELNVHHLNRHNLQQLSGAGMKVTEAGIESLSTPSLRLMGKGTTAVRNLQFMRDCLLEDIYVAWSYLLGFPGETEEIFADITAALPKLSHFPPPHPTPVGFERFSAYHSQPEKYNLKLVPYKFYFLTYPFAQKDIFRLAYHFDNYNPAPYKEGLEKWINEILTICNRWQALWRNPREFIPRLYHLPGGPSFRIIDSRNGEEREHCLSPQACRLLLFLNHPHSKAAILKEFRSPVVLTELQELEQRGLVFRDETRYLSLVFPQRVKVPGYLK